MMKCIPPSAVQFSTFFSSSSSAFIHSFMHEVSCSFVLFCLCFCMCVTLTSNCMYKTAPNKISATEKKLNNLSFVKSFYDNLKNFEFMISFPFASTFHSVFFFFSFIFSIFLNNIFIFHHFSCRTK